MKKETSKMLASERSRRCPGDVRGIRRNSCPMSGVAQQMTDTHRAESCRPVSKTDRGEMTVMQSSVQHRTSSPLEGRRSRSVWGSGMQRRWAMAMAVASNRSIPAARSSEGGALPSQR